VQADAVGGSSETQRRRQSKDGWENSRRGVSRVRIKNATAQDQEKKMGGSLRRLAERIPDSLTANRGAHYRVGLGRLRLWGLDQRNPNLTVLLVPLSSYPRCIPHIDPVMRR
jgi:hypothetical protein